MWITYKFYTNTYLYIIMCLGVDTCHSIPRNTWDISIKWSSTTFAKW